MRSIDRHPQLTLVAVQITCEGSAFLRNLILARLIGADEMGLAVALALGIRVLEMIGDLGLDRLLIQVEQHALADMRPTVHLMQLVKGACLAGLAVVLAQAFVHAINPAIDPSIFVLAALSLLVRGAINCDYRERQRFRDFRPALIVEGGSNVLAALAIGPIALMSQDYTALAWASVIQAVALCGLSHMFASRRMKIGLHRPALLRGLHYGLPVAINGAVMFVALQGDRVIVAMHFSAADLARFAIAAQLAHLPAQMGGRYILASDLPRFASISANAAALRTHLVRRLRTVVIIAIIGSVFLGVAGNMLVQVLYGNTYMLAPEIFWLLAISAGMHLVRYVPNTQLISMERTRTVLASNIPRLLVVPLALYLATQGVGMAAVIGVGVFGEALSLTYVLVVTLGTTSQSAYAGIRESLGAS